MPAVVDRPVVVCSIDDATHPDDVMMMIRLADDSVREGGGFERMVGERVAGKRCDDKKLVYWFGDCTKIYCG
uniref:Uncharacterized protein n=1 Tax=Setaria digitata TaxID=48799 RepID=A0A915PQC6_9BILA